MSLTPIELGIEARLPCCNLLAGWVSRACLGHAPLIFDQEVLCASARFAGLDCYITELMY